MGAFKQQMRVSKDQTLACLITSKAFLAKTKTAKSNCANCCLKSGTLCLYVTLFVPDFGLDRGERAKHPSAAVHHAHRALGGRDALEACGHG